MADRPIVVGVDGTDPALQAVAWAAEEARLRHCALRLVHAAPYLGTPDDPDIPGRADAVLSRALAAARRVANELAVDVDAVPDPPVAALLDASARAELLVIGATPGEDGPGSVTLDVTTAARCPVTVVRGDSAADHRRRAHPAPVVLGVESVDVDATAATIAFDDAARHHGEVVVVHVPSNPDHLAGSSSSVREQLAPWRSDHPVGVQVRIGQGDPGLALLHESTTARHVVLGTRGRDAVRPAGPGPVSRFVLRHSPVPVTVVPRSPAADSPRAAAFADPHDRAELW